MSEQSETPKFVFLLNAMEAAGWAESPARHDYGGKRALVLDYVARLERERDEIRIALAGADIASLPSDFPTVRMAHQVRADHDKFLWQVRDTCARAEAAERELEELRGKLEKYGRHWDICISHRVPIACDCGFKRALAPPEK